MSLPSPLALQPAPILFLTGASATGKSEMCRYAARVHGWLALDLDVWQADGIHVHGLHDVWSLYRTTGRHQPLVELLRNRVIQAGATGVVVGFPSGFAPGIERIRQLLPDIRTRYLVGAPEHCLAAFVQREAQNGRGLPGEWWLANNLKLRMLESEENLFACLDSPRMQPFTVPVFHADGSRRNPVDIWKDLQH